MDKGLIITLEKLNCASKCCGTFIINSADDVDGKVRKEHKFCSKLKKLCCCLTTKKVKTSTST